MMKDLFIPEFDTTRLVRQKIEQDIRLHRLQSASDTYEILVDYINNFEKDLDEKHEIGGRLVSFGQTEIFHIIDIGYYNPDIITFFGENSNGKKIQLIQHVSQLNVLLVALQKLPDQPARRIGYKLAEELQKKKDE